METCMGMFDVIAFGGAYDIDYVLTSMDMFSGEIGIHHIRAVKSFKNLFPSLSMDDGEDNRMPEVTLDAVFKSTPWDFDFDFEDLINALMYRLEKGIDYLGVVCPLCRKSVLEDIIIMLDEDDVYFCSKCNVLLWIVEEE